MNYGKLNILISHALVSYILIIGREKLNHIMGVFMSEVDTGRGNVTGDPNMKPGRHWGIIMLQSNVVRLVRS